MMTVAGENRLIQSRPDDFFSYLLSVDGNPVSSVTVLITDRMAGLRLLPEDCATALPFDFPHAMFSTSK
ncbi:MAG: hypothetical protein ABJM26_10135 [Anderseniella sp.]